MWTTDRTRIYQQFRTAGYRPITAWERADIVAQFRQHETDDDSPEPEEIGAMRICLECDDEQYDAGDMLEPFRGSDGRWRTREELEREHTHMLETCGVWGTIGEVWNGTDWEIVDSCWGHAGYENPDSPIENEYVIDHMRACLEHRANMMADILALP
jgi:hypothetical protein